MKLEDIVLSEISNDILVENYIGLTMSSKNSIFYLPEAERRTNMTENKQTNRRHLNL